MKDKVSQREWVDEISGKGMVTTLKVIIFIDSRRTPLWGLECPCGWMLEFVWGEDCAHTEVSVWTKAKQ